MYYLDWGRFNGHNFCKITNMGYTQEDLDRIGRIKKAYIDAGASRTAAEHPELVGTEQLKEIFTPSTPEARMLQIYRGMFPTISDLTAADFVRRFLICYKSSGLDAEPGINQETVFLAQCQMMRSTQVKPFVVNTEQLRALSLPADRVKFKSRIPIKLK